MKKLLILFTVSVLLFSGCLEKEEVQEQPAAAVEKKPVVAVTEAKEEKYSPVLEFGGSFKPFREANLSARMPGKIKKIHYREGATVQKGSVIVTLSGEMAEAAEAELEAVEKDYERVKDLVDSGVLPQQQLDHLEAKLNASKAKVKMTKENMEIIAPFDGMVAEHMLREGEEFMLVNPGLTPGFSHANGIIRFMDLNRLFLEIQVDEKELPLIQKIKDIEVVADAYPDTKIKGKIYATETLVSVISRTAVVKIEINNAKKLIKPGMFGRVKISLPEVKAVMVPRLAVARQAGTNQHYLFVIENNVALRKEVEILEDLGDFYAVKGVESGEMVVSAGKTKLRDNVPVTVSNK
ncbi:efflux RND transporter periplasmic adaptor subunit [bacterium]|nr:efflux RND transporter periplasmic adaptor subunit [bacterium]